MAAALLILAVLVAGAAAHDTPPPSPPPAPYYYPTISCPSHPHTLCDFYFDGYENVVPTFYLDDGIIGDHPLIPKARSTLSWIGDLSYFAPGIKDYLTNDWVLANSRNATFLTYPEGTYDYQWAVDTFDQFYTNANTDAISHLYARNWHPKNKYWHQEDRCFYENKCVFLPFSAVFIHKGAINLGYGDSHTEYQVQRRCVVFKTKQ